MARLTIREQLTRLRIKFRNLNADYAMFKKAAKEVIGQEKYSEIIAIVKDKARCQE